MIDNSWIVERRRRARLDPRPFTDRLWNAATTIKLSIVVITGRLHRHITSGCFTRDVMAHFTDIKLLMKP